MRGVHPTAGWTRRLALALLSVSLLGGLSLLVSCGPDASPADSLRHQVLAEIHADVRIAAYEVQVHVESVDPGRVVLSGSVDRPQVKELAEQIAYGVTGVDVVENRIEVRGPRGADDSSGSGGADAEP